MEIARAVIVATRSAQDRPWSSVGSGPKPLVSIAARPILFHTLDALSNAGVLEAALLVERNTMSLYRTAVGDGSNWAIALTYEECEQGIDMPGALAAMSEFVDDEPVIVLRADLVLREHLRDHVIGFAHQDLDALALMLRNPSALDSTRMAGSYLLSPQAVSIMLGQRPGVSDPLRQLRLEGGFVRTLDVEGCLACDGSEASLLEANRHALAGIRADFDSSSLDAAELQGAVVIHPTATVRRTLVRGPAIIGPGSEIIDSYIGPYTAIGSNVRIEGAEIEHSIVMDDAQLLFVGSRLETSLIGRGASIVRRFDMPSAVRVSIGDGAHVALS